jgi:subtilase family serine protease
MSSRAGVKSRCRAGGAAFSFMLTALTLASSAACAGQVNPYAIRADFAEFAADPSTTAHFGCELRSFTEVRRTCYGPEAIRKAYGLDSLLAAGNDGFGQTIVIIDAYGSPTLQADLDTFDAVFGLLPPPSIRQIRMPGSAPFNYFDFNQLGWAEETSLDVQWAHAMAPGANIVVVAAKSNDDADILAAQNYAIDNKLGYIISESFGQSELALLQEGAEGRKILADNEASYRRAAKGRISVLVSSGDDGSSGRDINGNFLSVPVANYPASSPNVTTVGGTNLFFGTATNANPNGSYQGEVVWNDGFGAAGGGGVSGTFETPDYQENNLPDGTKNSLKEHRGYPDVAYNAGIRGGVIVHLGFLDQCCGANGFYTFGGTSAGTPQWAGITAVANQMRQKPLGLLNARLYQMGKRGLLKTLMHDITLGDNGLNGVAGYAARPNWDLATGWGTPFSGFVDALINEKVGDD